MNHSASQPPPAVAAGRRNWNGLLVSVLGGAAVFLAFAAYGRFAPTTYSATAQILLTPAAGRPLSLGGTTAPAVQLRDAAVDDESLKSAAKILKLGAGAAAEQAARQRLTGNLDVQATGSGVFEVTVRQPTASGSQALCNLLARHAAAQATRLFGGGAPDPNVAREAARTKAAAALAQFIARHPELTPNPVVTPVAPGSPEAVDMQALRAERVQIEAKLQQLPPPDTTTDNPFEHPSNDAARLRRRLAEIDQTIATRKKAERKAEQASRVAPEVEAEWKRLLKEVGQPTVPAMTTDAACTVMLREAGLPAAPIQPNRRMVALVGAIVALATGLMLAVLVGWRRRRASARTRQWSAFDAPSHADPELIAGGTVRLVPGPGSEPPQADARPVDPVGPTAWAGAEPARPASDPPPIGGEAPRPASDPARPPSNPPRIGSEPPRPGSDPPRVGSEPPRPGSLPPGAGSEPGVAAEAPRDPSEPPRPVGGSAPPGGDAPRAAPVVPRPTSSAPPRPAGDAPLAATIPTPLPKLESIPVGAAKPGAPVLDANARVSRATQIGLGRLDPKVVERPAAPEPPRTDRAAAAAVSQRSDASPSTLRPPPPDKPPAEGVLARGVLEGAERSLPGEAREGDESWTGPSRAHRRSVSARRTTQVMGSPIPPVVRRGSDQGGSRPPGAPQPSTRPTSSTYSYVSERPEGVRPPLTPPYYSEPKQLWHATGGQDPNRTPRPPMMVNAATAERARIVAQPVRSDWSPDPAVDLQARRAVADQIFPLAVERCFVLGVVAAPEARAQKTRVTAELALALAEARHPRVLLMEADFQWPQVHQIMRVEMPMSQGLSQQLRARAQHSQEPWTVLECTPTLHVLAEGIIRSPGTILTVQFDRGTKSLRTYYDIILLDGPDLTSRSECNALSTVVDGIVYVESQSHGAELGEAAELLDKVTFAARVAV